MSFNLKIVAHWSDHEEFASVSAQKYLGLIEPGVGGEVAALGQFLDLLVGLEGVVLHLEELEDVSPRTADEVRLGGTDRNRLSALHAEVAHRQPPTPRNVQEHQLVVRFRSHAARVLGLGGRKSNYLER